MTHGAICSRLGRPAAFRHYSRLAPATKSYREYPNTKMQAYVEALWTL